MPIRSMTGFGKGRSACQGFRIDVELGTINRKQFDARVMLPRNLQCLEPRIVKLLGQSISRGQVSGSVRISDAGMPGGRNHILDIELTRQYVRAIRTAAGKLGLADDLTARSLVGIRELFVRSEQSEDAEILWPGVKEALESALQKLVKMRVAEGKALRIDLQAHYKKLQDLLRRIAGDAPRIQKRYRDSLLERIRTSGIEIQMPDAAILKELTLFADRSDISEEIVRLRSHFQQAEKLLADGGNEAVGRECDFLYQEMFREINTIGNKANDAFISTQVVQFKTFLERAREQVQNVE